MWTTIKEKWPTFVTFQACIFMIFYAYGCEPKTTSLIDPGQKVTRPQLKTEIELLMMQSENRIADLDRQEALRQAIFEQGLIMAQTRTINPIGVVTSLLAVLGIGMSADDIRLRKKVKVLDIELKTVKDGTS